MPFEVVGEKRESSEWRELLLARGFRIGEWRRLCKEQWIQQGESFEGQLAAHNTHGRRKREWKRDSDDPDGDENEE